MRKQWSTEEEQYLRDNYGKISINKLAMIYEVSYQAIVDKAHKLGLNRKCMSGEYWQSYEDKILQDHFMWAPKNKLLILLPSRTWSSVYQRGSVTLGLSRHTQDKYDINYRFFETLTPESAYVLGFVAADGHLKINHGLRNETKLQFELASYDRDILDKIKVALDYEGPVALSNRGTSKLQISNRKICLDIKSLGIPTDNKTTKLEWPSSLPDSLAHHFARGLFDGDGSIYAEGTNIRCQFLGTYKILSALLDMFPCNTTVNHIYDRSKNGCNVCCIKFSGRKAISILDWLYQDATIYLDRKYYKTIELLNKRSEPS